jgi:hypothetical protein
MKKIKLITLIFVFMFSLNVSASAEQAVSYKGYPVVNVMVNNQRVASDVPGINVDNTTLVPLRVIAENLGVKVDWNASTSTAILTKTQVEPVTNAMDLDRSKIYHVLQREMNSMQNLVQQIQIAKDLYISDQSTSSILNIKQVKLVEKKKIYKDLNDQIIDFQQEYADQGTTIAALSEITKKYDELVTNYESAVDELDKYTQDSARQLRSYFYFLSLANDQLYQLQTSISLIEE